MKQIGLGLISISALLICLVVFQNCGEFQATTSNVSSLNAQTPSCQLGTAIGCPIANGVGSYPCGGSPVANCTVGACNAGYTISGNACVLTGSSTCSNGNTAACGIANGTGSETCTNNTWGACTVVSCNTNYAISNGACVLIPLPCNGTFTVTIPGLGSVAMSLVETGTGAVTISSSGTPIGTGTCVNGNASFNMTGLPRAPTCTGPYTVTNGKTHITGNCGTAGAFTADEN